MDSLIAAAARALVVGDVLDALKHVSPARRPAGAGPPRIAMAQLGEHPRARELLRRAARGFGAHEELARARCVVAEAEVALAMRDLRGSPRTLAAAAATLEARSDRANALHARLIAVRRLLLLGRLDEAASALASVGALPLPSRLTAPSGGSEHQAEGRRTAEGWSRAAGCGEAAHSERGGGFLVGALPLPSRLTAPLEGSEPSERGGSLLDGRGLPPSLLAVAELAAAEVALRSLRTAPAQAALARASRRPNARACPRSSPRWPRRAPRSIVPPPGACAPARSSRCASTRSKRSSRRARWWSTPAAAVCAPAQSGCRWRAARCCSRWRARLPRRGPATSIGMR
jgi:hypothetical protein